MSSAVSQPWRQEFTHQPLYPRSVGLDHELDALRPTRRDRRARHRRIGKSACIHPENRFYLHPHTAEPLLQNSTDTTNLADTMARKSRGNHAAGSTAQGYTRSLEWNDFAFQPARTHALVLQIGAGDVGVSLDDVRGDRPRHCLLSPPESARNLIQAHGRNRRVGQRSRTFRTILTLAGSGEARVTAAAQRKAAQTEPIHDRPLRCGA